MVATPVLIPRSAPLEGLSGDLFLTTPGSAIRLSDGAGNSYAFWTGKAWINGTIVQNNTGIPLTQITFQSGVTIEVAAGHRFYVVDEAFPIVAFEVRADDLQVGQTLCRALAPSNFEGNVVEYPNATPPPSTVDRLIISAIVPSVHGPTGNTYAIESEDSDLTQVLLATDLPFLVGSGLLLTTPL